MIRKHRDVTFCDVPVLLRLAAVAPEPFKLHLPRLPHAFTDYKAYTVQIRKATKKGAFPSEDAVMKAFYLRTAELYKNGTEDPYPTGHWYATSFIVMVRNCSSGNKNRRSNRPPKKVEKFTPFTCQTLLP